MPRPAKPFSLQRLVPFNHDRAGDARFSGRDTQVVNEKITPQDLHTIPHPCRTRGKVAPQMMVRVNASVIHTQPTLQNVK
jgi:hypothetical protein